MIRVTIELIPGGIGVPRTLGVAEITNDGKTSRASKGARGGYDVCLSKWAPRQSQTWKTGRVENFDRHQRGPWDLLYLALANCVGNRNKSADDNKKGESDA